jgi:hypothetical protein
VVAVVAGSRPSGYTDGALNLGTTSGTEITLLEAANDWETEIIVELINENDITGDSYSLDVTDYYVEADGDTVELGGILLENTTTSTDFFTAPILGSDPDFGDDYVIVTEGFRIYTDQPHSGIGGVYDLSQTTDADADTELTLYFAQAYMEGSGSAANRANRTKYMNTVEFRFTGFVTAGGDTNYASYGSAGSYSGGRTIAPFEVWDTETNTRLMATHYRFYNTGAPYGEAYWISDEYINVCNIPYFEADGVTVTDFQDIHDPSDSEYWGYDTSNPNSRSDWAYRFAFNEADFADPSDTSGALWSVGDVWTLTPYMTMIKEAGKSFTFTTTAPTITDTLVSMDDIKVVPNPYYIYADWDMSVNRRKVQFTNVPMNSTISIYTLAGELVAILDHHGDATATAGGRGYNSNRIGTVDWNIWTYEFTEAAYGLYIYVVKTDDVKTKVGKFAIIR